MQPQQDAAWCQALNDRLERLFHIDGRDNPEHPHHATYTGLTIKYSGISTPRDENNPTS